MYAIIPHSGNEIKIITMSVSNNMMPIKLQIDRDKDFSSQMNLTPKVEHMQT